MTNDYSISVTYVVAVLAVCSELLSNVDSLIAGKIEGISPILKLSRMPGPLEINRFARKFPNGKTGNFLSQTGKRYSESSET